MALLLLVLDTFFPSFMQLLIFDLDGYFKSLEFVITLFPSLASCIDLIFCDLLGFSMPLCL